METHNCSMCHGKGYILKKISQLCDGCNGEGMVFDQKQNTKQYCRKCNGHRKIQVPTHERCVRCNSVGVLDEFNRPISLKGNIFTASLSRNNKEIIDREITPNKLAFYVWLLSFIVLPNIDFTVVENGRFTDDASWKLLFMGLSQSHFWVYIFVRLGIFFIRMFLQLLNRLPG